MYKIISFGHRCSTRVILDELGEQTEAYPFDWTVSKLDTIKDCIETQFINFLDSNNYVSTDTETYNMIDGVKHHICHQPLELNIFYDKEETAMKQTYACNLAIIHHTDEWDYFKRCINRFYALLESNCQKYYVHFYPLMGENDFKESIDSILNNFDNFSQYITGKTENIFGMYFLFIKHETIYNEDENKKLKGFIFKENPNYNVYVIYCNKEFIDGGPPFLGNYGEEKEVIMTTIRNVLSA
jgi:hypothetical protein